MKNYKISASIQAIDEDKGYKAKRTFDTTATQTGVNDAIDQVEAFLLKFAKESNSGLEYSPEPLQGELDLKTGEVK